MTPLSPWSTWLVPARHRASSTVLSGAALLLVLGAVVLRLGSDRVNADALVVLLCFGLAMIAGEMMRLGQRDDLGAVPVATAAGAGLALAHDSGGNVLSFGSPAVVVLVAVTMALGAIWHTLRDGRIPRFVGYAVRLIVVALVAVAYRDLPLVQDRSLSAAAADGTHVRWQVALVMLGLLIPALMVEIVLRLWLSRDEGARSWRDRVREAAQERIPIAIAAISTAIVVALGLRTLGLAAIPLFLLPLVLMRFALQRHENAQRARQQAIAALSVMTDLAGYTRAGHSGRVAALSGAVGQVLRLSERELVELDAAALLHDIGQVALRDPVADGATVGLAPIDQQRIANDSADIVRRTGAMDQVATIISEHPTPFRFLREEGRPQSQTARVLKVCNAFDDLAGADPDARDVALERIMLGLGYEYDPEVVDALVTVTRSEAVPAHL